MTLLEKCREAKVKQGRPKFAVSPDDLDVMFAWMNGDITLAQIRRGIGAKSQVPAYSHLARCVIHAWQTGHLKRAVPKA